MSLIEGERPWDVVDAVGASIELHNGDLRARFRNGYLVDCRVGTELDIEAIDAEHFRRLAEQDRPDEDA